MIISKIMQMVIFIFITLFTNLMVLVLTSLLILMRLTDIMRIVTINMITTLSNTNITFMMKIMK